MKLLPKNIGSESLLLDGAKLRSDGAGGAYWRLNNIDLVSFDFPLEKGLGFTSGGMDLKDLSMWAWGSNSFGQLGINTSGEIANQSSPVSVVTAQRFVGSGAGFVHSLALNSAGETWVWGNNRYGQLGINESGDAKSKSIPVSVCTTQRFIQVSAGAYQSFALTSTGEVWDWGYNGGGQLGDKTIIYKSTPVSVCTAERFIQISGGGYYALALKSNGEMWTWGTNTSGQLGDNAVNYRSTPVSVCTDQRFIQVTAGFEHGLALKSNGEVWAWGYNADGEIGDNTAGATTYKSTPVSVCTAQRFIQVAVGGYHSLALTSAGEVWGWGYNVDGELGINTAGATEHRSTPVSVCTAQRFIQVAVGSYHSLALTSAGEVWGWGSNSAGQLGDNTIISRSTPVLVLRVFA